MRNDSLVLATEGNAYSNCYTNKFAFSERSLQERFGTDSFKEFFDGKFLINWAFFSAPRHPLLMHVLNAIVEIVKLEYLGRSVLVHMVISSCSNDCSFYTFIL